MDKWNGSYNKLKAPEPYGDTVTYKLGGEWLSSCNTVEDWGCGAGWFRQFCTAPTYIGVDGSNTPFLTKKAELVTYRSSVEGIFMRHVLEHNYEWKQILRNAIESFSKRMCLILFTPLSATTVVLTTNPGYGNVPDIAFRMKDLEDIFDEYTLSYHAETFPTETQYGVETIIYLEKV